MDIENLKPVVASLVEEKLSSKEHDEHRAGIESALKDADKTICDLYLALEDKVAELADVQSVNQSLTEEISEKAGKIEVLAQSLDTANNVLSEVTAKLDERVQLEETASVKVTELEAKVLELQAALDKIELEKVITVRVNELASLKVLRSGANLEKQIAEVALMTEEAFTAYKQDLVDLRDEIATNVSVVSTVSSETASLAALDVESIVVSQSDRYQLLGQTMAGNISKRLNR